ncbi:M15 family metallopeptidase [Rhizobium leguminosarum]|uniref:M15 family metallopeptidase n=1 Tax=Rhizobium leguminosarum TaxID=384 RepID=UPI001C9824A8|nr:M15 family metallopeptidase [Rhizobium leguminosarum]MBY5438859.1 M15 family metallopeptidase [Rhizobium leguminosarum]
MSRISLISALHPKMVPVARSIADHMASLHQANKTEFSFQIFETYRSPVRQNELFTEKTTKARAWEGAHNVGLAVDFVPFLTATQAAKYRQEHGSSLPGWFWPDPEHSDWNILAKVAMRYGCKPPIVTKDFVDRPHCEHPLFDKIQSVGF